MASMTMKSRLQEIPHFLRSRIRHDLRFNQNYKPLLASIRSLRFMHCFAICPFFLSCGSNNTLHLPISSWASPSSLLPSVSLVPLPPYDEGQRQREEPRTAGQRLVEYLETLSQEELTQLASQVWGIYEEDLQHLQHHHHLQQRHSGRTTVRSLFPPQVQSFLPCTSVLFRESSSTKPPLTAD